MTAVEAAFTRLIDYAGLYPPAGLEMPTAVRKYLDYSQGPDAWMLGRFIVDLARLREYRDAADDVIGVPLSVITPADFDPATLARYRAAGFRIESIEIKCDEPLRMARLREQIPEDMECYFEIPLQQSCTGAVDILASVNARAKLRMGGTVAEAFPPPTAVMDRLELLLDRCVPFKATAGLHHPIRSMHSLTYAADAPRGTTHGFINLLCAVALLRAGAPRSECMRAFEEQDRGAFLVGTESITVQQRVFDSGALRGVRECFVSFGSCSFTEPTSELKELGWL